MRELYIIKLTRIENGSPIFVPVHKIQALESVPEFKGQTYEENEGGKAQPSAAPTPAYTAVYLEGGFLMRVKEDIAKIKDTANARFQLWKEL